MMIIMDIFIIVFVLLISVHNNYGVLNAVNEDMTQTSFDSIVSSQCKASCLYMYPWTSKSSVGNQHETNIVWHKVMELCAKNPICLQCSLPCDIPKYLLSNCTYLCKGRHLSCLNSCNHLKYLNENKYGKCQADERNVVVVEDDSEDDDDEEDVYKRLFVKSVVSECQQDADCDDIQKCCKGKCEMPFISVHKNIPGVPSNLSIVERKKGKTVILKWTDHDLNSNRKPIIYIIEGKWSYSDQDHDVNSKWGYLAQTINNNWIILRNIHRGRWYKFRVAAISKQGTYGYSKPTDLFILSQPPKPPSQPQNLTQQSFKFINSTFVNTVVNWLPPKNSDLPVTSYRVIVYEIRDNNEQIEVSNSRVSDRLDYELKELNIYSTYIFELYALCDHLESQPIRLTIRPNQQQQQQQQVTTTLIQNFTLNEIYFHNGLVKARLQWSLVASSIDNQTFLLTWFPIKCSTTTVMPLQQPISASTSKFQYDIYELKYNCDYVVNIRLTSINNKFSTIQFTIPKCSDIKVVGKLKPFCSDPIDLQTATTTSITTTSIKITTETTRETTTTIRSPSIFNKINATLSLINKNKILKSSILKQHQLKPIQQKPEPQPPPLPPLPSSIIDHNSPSPSLSVISTNNNSIICKQSSIFIFLIISIVQIFYYIL